MKKIVSTLILLLLGVGQSMANDPLPSWNDGPSKTAIMAFVESVTNKESKDYVVPAERIATFDNDGTLWSEQPAYFQAFFAMDRVHALASENPQWKREEPFASILKGDLKGAFANDEHHEKLLRMIIATHTGMTTEAYEKVVMDWVSSAKHPTNHRRYTELVYQPMLELLEYLRNSEFKTYIVSGGGIEFMRPWVESIYGIPPEQVIGSSIKTQFEIRDGVPVIARLAEINFLNDKELKPIAIHQHIGRRPIAAFGNSDGDLQMLQWTMAGEGPRFALYLHHTDDEREWAYDRQSGVGRLDKGLDEALEKGWTLVDMKSEWKVIYPYELNQQAKE